MTDTRLLPESVVVQHTPTPWRLCITGNIGSAIEAQTGRKNHEWDDGYRIVASYQEGCSSDLYSEQEANRRANGELIIRAVNSHEALMKALHWIVNNPAAHPVNMVTVAQDALASTVTGRDGKR